MFPHVTLNPKPETRRRKKALKKKTEEKEEP